MNCSCGSSCSRCAAKPNYRQIEVNLQEKQVSIFDRDGNRMGEKLSAAETKSLLLSLQEAVAAIEGTPPRKVLPWGR